MFPRIATQLLVLLSAMVPFFTVHAQVLTPVGYEGRFHLANQEIIAVHVGGTQYLALESRYGIEEPQGRTGHSLRNAPTTEPLAPPAKAAWVIPIPPGGQSAVPATQDLFGELYEFTRPSVDKMRYSLRTGRPQGLNRFGESMLSDSLAQEEVSGLSWTLFEGSGAEALGRLKAWTADQGLAGLNEEVAQDYAGAGWTFAAGLLENPEPFGLLGPAAFAFPSTDLVVPLRFQADAGEFDLALYTFSDKVYDKRPLSNWRISGVNAWGNLHRQAWFDGYIGLGQTSPPENLIGFLSGLGGNNPLPPFDPAALNIMVLGADRLNGFGRTTARQSQDFALFEKGAAPAPGASQPGSVASRPDDRKGLRDPQQRILRQNRRQRSY